MYGKKIITIFFYIKKLLQNTPPHIPKESLDFKDSFGMHVCLFSNGVNAEEIVIIFLPYISYAA